jgi:hypothetical protein
MNWVMLSVKSATCDFDSIAKASAMIKSTILMGEK